MNRRAFISLIVPSLLFAPRVAEAQRRPANFDDMVPGTGLFGIGNDSPVPRTLVNYPANYRPGTIVINARERRLYFIVGNGQALRYGIGVGRDGFGWGGVTRVSAKREWPDWTPPAQMRRRQPG